MTTPTVETATVRVPLNMAPALLDIVNRAAAREGLTRNAFIRQAILRHLPPALLAEWESTIPAP